MPNVGIVYNILWNEEAVCYISDGDESGLVKSIVDYLNNLSDSGLEILQNKYHHVYEALKTPQNCKSENLLKELEAYL